MRDFDFEKGEVLLVDKPQTWTSFDIVKKLRYALKVKKIGHAGTLDPLATGLLIVCTGKFTKRINEFQGMDKTYEGIIEVGKTTPSYDLETEFDSEADYTNISESALLQAAKLQTGSFDQIPPVFSAIKVDGKRAYKSARKNEELVMKSRPVQIDEFELTKIDLPEVHFRIVCSKGTYIRSIAHDFGKELGCGAYLKYLRRTAIGDFRVNDAYDMQQLIAQAEKIRAEKNSELS
ncbi:tRNA pseudouridine(55) synthase TruB [Reichenbachiella sp. MALMAid0571]|uniref:tRNA pseudouridine(55) synthase TruB n=1 Tax=Reichenbachiella sp. MALMAid0571 TaxID=3143939 RepID=UPI0032DE7884